MIIHHLQRRHRFHPRPDSPLHLSNEEPVLGYLKFSAKGTKSEVFGMPIPDSLITAEIQQATYYREYLEKVTHHKKYLAGETGGVQNPPAPKPTQPVRKPKAPTRPSISIPVASTQPAPTSAPAKSQENKRKQATKTTDKPAKVKRIKHRSSRKTRQPRSSPKSVGASEAEEVPAEEPQVTDEDANYQKDVEKSIKDAYALPKGPLPPVVIREPESGKYQPLPEVPGKGKAKVTEERVSEPTGSSGHDESPYALLGQSDNEEESEKVVLEAKEGGQDEDEGFTATVYPNVQENVKLAVEEPSPKEHQQLKATTTDTTTTTTTLPPRQAPQQSTTEAMMVKCIGELERIMADLIQVNKDIEERLDSHGSRLYTLEQLDIPQRVSIVVSEVVTDAVDWAMQAPLPLKKSMNRDHSEDLAQDLAEARKKKKKSCESLKTPPGSPSHQPPPPPSPAGPSRASGAPRASGLAQMPPSPPPPLSTTQESPFKGSAAPSPSKTTASAEYQSWMTTDIKLRPFFSLTLADLEMDDDMAPDEQAQSSDDEDIGIAHIPTRGRPHTKAQRQQTTTTGGPPGQVTIQSDFFFNKDLEYLRYASKGRRPALSISKMKATYYPDAGLEQMVPDYFWIEEECKYDIAAMYGISHWWFKRQQFYIDRHTFEGDHSAVRTYMRILSIVRIEVFSMYGYDYMKKIVLRYLNHLPPKDKKILTTAVNQWTRQLVIRQRVEDFQLGIESYQTQMMMRFNEIHKFSDGTLLQIDEALDYRVKEFRINRLNPGLNMRFWTRKDVDRCNTFMFAIQRHLRTRRIFRNLESFVGGRVREGDYRLLRRTD
nr:histone deacetylase 14 [Tanacetum cinerariifolium]